MRQGIFARRFRARARFEIVSDGVKTVGARGNHLGGVDDGAAPPRATITSAAGRAAANRARASASMGKSGLGMTLSMVSAGGPARAAMRRAIS